MENKRKKKFISLSLGREISKPKTEFSFKLDLISSPTEKRLFMKYQKDLAATKFKAKENNLEHDKRVSSL